MISASIFEVWNHQYHFYSDACASASDQQGSNPNTQSGIDSYSIVMTENYHPATYTFGTIDCVAIALNVISIIYFPKLSNVLNSEIIILMFTLLALSLVSLSLFVIKLFDLVQTSIRENLYLMTMFAPVCYHIVVPAILMKAAAFFDKGYKVFQKINLLLKPKNVIKIVGNLWYCVKKSVAYNPLIFSHNIQAFLQILYRISRLLKL